MNRKLPIGIQDFESIRRDGCVYVDKTAYVYKLVNEGKPYFLGRPRRFGKSLLVSTLRAYLEGRRELFEGLAIERLEGDGPGAWTARPVFHLDLNDADYAREGGLEAKLDLLLRGYEDCWGLAQPATRSNLSFGTRFWRLLETAHEQSGHRAAVLVDEYDKPLLDCAHDVALEDRNCATLRAFYSVLKGADAHLRFVFLTGVTKFSKVARSSDLNQLYDISLSSVYADVCGITEAELLAVFGPEVDVLAHEMGLGRNECIDALRTQYDGYCFHPDGPDAPEGAAARRSALRLTNGRYVAPAVDKNADASVDAAERSASTRKVYNPFSLLNTLAKRQMGSYWFEAGTPTSLACQMKESGLDPRRLVDGSICATSTRLFDYRADDPSPIPLLYQSGYLTIRALDSLTGEYELGVPNGEVEWGLVEGLLPAWAPGYSESRGADVRSLLRRADAGDVDGMRDVISALFASTPYTKADDPFENYFQAVLWLVFALLGRYVRTEVHQASGRVDCVVECARHVYVIEFKREGTAEDALGQIAERGYAAPFAADSRQVHLIGCAFDPDTRLLADWQEA